MELVTMQQHMQRPVLRPPAVSAWLVAVPGHAHNPHTCTEKAMYTLDKPRSQQPIMQRRAQGTHHRNGTGCEHQR